MEWRRLGFFRAFTNDPQPICSEPREFLLRPARPTDLGVRLLLRPESEMQAPVVGRTVTGLADHLLRLLLAAVKRHHARANRAAVRLCSDQPYFNPVIVAAYVVTQ